MEHMFKTSLIILIVSAFAIQTGAVTYGDSIRLSLTAYQDGDIQLRDAELMRAERDPPTDSDYRIELQGKDGETLYSHRFSPFFATSGSGGNLSGNGSTVDSRNITLYLPFNESTWYLTAFHDTEQKDRLTLPDLFCQQDGTCSSYCDGKQEDIDCTCGDSVCDSIESPETCYRDCRTDDPGTGGNVDEPSDTPDNVPKEPGGDDFNRLYLIPLLLVIFSLAFYLYRHGKVEEKEKYDVDERTPG